MPQLHKHFNVIGNSVGDTLYTKFLSLSLLIVGLLSCEKPFDEKDKLFHGAPQSNGIGGLSFGLYNDKRYKVTNSGGIGWSDYTGSYILSGDTITLKELDKESGLEKNRLVIYRYSLQDSNYWKWKYSDKFSNTDKTLGTSEWQNFKDADQMLGKGDVYQLDENSKPLKDKYHFLIAFDSLKNYR
jgi:hypothetical protein